MLFDHDQDNKPNEFQKMCIIVQSVQKLMSNATAVYATNYPENQINQYLYSTKQPP